jgi:hypothetical protein
MYNTTLKLKNNEIAAKVNAETGEVTTFETKPSNVPEGMSRLKYTDFSIVNNETTKKLAAILDNEEMGVIYYMISISDFNSNSLNPLSDELSLREKANILRISKDRVKRITDKLFRLGVYLSIRVYEDQEKEYWVLNPNISWRGRLVKDSIFVHFQNCAITKLLN